MLGPNFQTHHNGLTLVQTGQEDDKAGKTSEPEAGQVAAIVDDDPCHQELGKIFDNVLVEEKPSDVLLGFIENYCIEAAEDFLPSKNNFIILKINNSLARCQLDQLICKSFYEGDVIITFFVVEILFIFQLESSLKRPLEVVKGLNGNLVDFNCH